MNATSKPKNRISLGHSGNALVLLIGANLVLYVLLIFLKAFYFMTSTSNVGSDTTGLYHQEIFRYFVLPSSLSQFIHQPWTLLSYMITHENLLDLFSNVLWLGAFGYILQSLGFNKKIIPLYLYGGLLGGLFFMLINLLPLPLNNAPYLAGATIAVITVAAGATTIAPKYKIFPMLGGGIPLCILFALYALISISSLANAGLAYISTLLFASAIGFFVMYQFKKGHDYSQWMYQSVHKIDDLFNPNKKYKLEEDKHQFFYQSASRKPFETKEHITQERIDQLLDKINTKGYDSLTKTEKEFLERASKDN